MPLKDLYEIVFRVRLVAQLIQFIKPWKFFLPHGIYLFKIQNQNKPRTNTEEATEYLFGWLVFQSESLHCRQSSRLATQDEATGCS